MFKLGFRKKQKIGPKAIRNYSLYYEYYEQTGELILLSPRSIRKVESAKKAFENIILFHKRADDKAHAIAEQKTGMKFSCYEGDCYSCGYEWDKQKYTTVKGEDYCCCR